MNYTKPEVVVVSEAVDLVRSGTNKLIQIVQEFQNYYSTSAAYEADE